MAPGLCRTGSLTANFDFTNGPFTCLDYWQGAAAGSIVMDLPSFDRTAFHVSAALPAGSPLIGPIDEGTEVYAFKAIIDARRSSGLGACAGCQSPVGICVSAITITQPAGTAGGDRFIGVPALRNFASWQGGFTGGEYYCQATPVRNFTWGSIKSLYR
jgi:hypothetical protein